MKNQKKTLRFRTMATAFMLLAVTAFPLCSEPWNITSDDAPLRKEIDYLNNAYFDGKLKITYINYSEEQPTNVFASTFYWADSKIVISVNPNRGLQENDELRISVLLHELCHAASFLYDSQFQVAGDREDVHEALSFKDQIARLKRLGCSVYGTD